MSIKRPVVLVGETGTSKSATTANFLRGLDKDATVRMGLRVIHGSLKDDTLKSQTKKTFLSMDTKI